MTQLTCPECKTLDFQGGRCPTCIEVRAARIVGLAIEWTRPALYPKFPDTAYVILAASDEALDDLAGLPREDER